MLKKFQASARQGENGLESAVYTSVHEYFEAVLNAVSRRLKLFQQALGPRHRVAPPAVEIIDYAPELAPVFRDLNVEWLEKYFVVEPIDRDVLGDPGGRIIAPGGAVLFARVDGAIVGTVALKHHGDGVYELTKMAVTERAQGAGIGRALMQACLERYGFLGGRRLFLESHSSLEPALHLYESAGFRRVPRETPSDYARADVYMVYRDA